MRDDGYSGGSAQTDMADVFQKFYGLQPLSFE
jgi:hypothetical protein